MNSQPVMLRIKSNYHAFSKKEQQISDFLMSDPRAFSRMTITAIAEKLGLATSTVYQFAKKLGYSGFREFRTDLLQEAYDPAISIHEGIAADDTDLEMAHAVFASSINSLQDTEALLVEADLDAAVELILASKTLTFFGMGGSNVVAYDAYHKFLRSPISCQYAADQHIQLMQASLMGPEDCVIATTHTGLSRATLEIAQVAKAAGARLIFITSYPSRPIKELADVILISVSQETGFRSESLSSRISQLALIDSLFTAVMFRNPDTAETLHRIRSAINLTKSEDVR